jgi:hypothetical protein
MPNELNETTILDDQTFNLGTSKDFKLKYDSADNRLEILNSSDTVLMHLSSAGALTITGAVTLSDDITVGKLLKLSNGSATIASGAVTVTSSHMQLDTEAAAATDDLDTLNGGEPYAVVILRTTSSARDVVVRHLGGGTGNIRLNGAVDFTLPNTSSTLTLMYDNGLSIWKEIARSVN